MRYMLLIYTDERLGATMTEEEGNAIMAAYYAYGAEATAAGIHLSSEALQPASQAKTVRVQPVGREDIEDVFAELAREQALAEEYGINVSGEVPASQKEPEDGSDDASSGDDRRGLGIGDRRFPENVFRG